jgi:hypothetical protein
LRSGDRICRIQGDKTDRIFYAAADAPQNSGARKITGYIPSKFLVRKGAYVVDPVPGASQNANLYSDSQGSNKTDGKIANPNNTLWCPQTTVRSKPRISPPASPQPGSRDHKLCLLR